MELTALTFEHVKSLADNGRVFAAGEEYAETGRIFRFSVTPTGISAKVYGSYGDYTITVTPEMKARCTCPYDSRVCKHVVAVLLHYLENDYSQVGDLKPSIPSALEQTLTVMPEDDLRALILRLVRDNADVRRSLLENVVIAPTLLQAVPADPKQVKTLKKAIDKAFKELEGQDYQYYESEQRIDLGFVFDAVLALNLDDQADVLWHVVEQGNKYLGEYELDTGFIEQAIGLYGIAVSHLELPEEENKSYLDTLLEALSWAMCDYGGVSEALQEAIEKLATAPEDVRYVIRRLEKFSEAEVRDWAISLYRKTGDDAGYLKARQANLHTERQHLELADYFDSLGESAQSLATLEAWVASREQQPEGVRFLAYHPDPATGRGEVLRRLIAHYTKTQDSANLGRILMVQANQEGVTLSLYQQVQSVAEKLGTWEEYRPELLKQSRGLERAKIYLYEHDWTRAIEFARLPGMEERVRALIADAVKEEHPDQAIELYDTLVQANIQQFNRNGYRAAARYASEVKRIYLTIIQDIEMAALYVAEIRHEHARRPALREEFAGL